jgi:hypothetical protein
MYPTSGSAYCSTCTASNELNCNSINGCGSTVATCLNCQIYGMNSAGKCLSCSNIYRNCLRCTNTQCSSCMGGYVLNTTNSIYFY